MPACIDVDSVRQDVDVEGKEKKAQADRLGPDPAWSMGDAGAVAGRFRRHGDAL